NRAKRARPADAPRSQGPFDGTFQKLTARLAYGHLVEQLPRKRDQTEASGIDALRIPCGVCPKARRKARRMRSRSPKPVSSAIASIGRRPCSSNNLARANLRYSIVFAGDCTVSRQKTRLNWRGLRPATFASRSTDNDS